MPAPARKQGLDAALRDLPKHPVRLRMALGAALLAAWYFGLFAPLSGRIDEASRRLADDRQRLALAREVEGLRRELGRARARLPESADRNEWLRGLMDGIRAQPVRLVSLDPQPSVEVGPYRAGVARITVEAPYPDAERFLRWLETGPHLARITQVRLGPKEKAGGPRQLAGPPTLELQLTLMGVLG